MGTSLSRIFAFIGFLSVLSGTMFLFKTPLFRVEQIVVHRVGDVERVPLTEVTSVTSVVGESIFLVSTTGLARQVAALPGIRRARVIPRLPNILEIEVDERSPVATLRDAQGDLYVDEQGVIVAGASSIDGTPNTRGLPVIFQSLSTEPLKAGDRVPARLVLGAIEVRAALRETGMTFEALAIGTDGITFQIDGTTTVIFGDPKDLNDKFGHLLSMRDFARERSFRYARLDLRSPTRPAFQLHAPTPVVRVPTPTTRPRP